MPIIKSISGIRGTIGGRQGFDLTHDDVMLFSAAFGSLIVSRSSRPKIVIGRDSRPSGEAIRHIVIGSLLSLGIDVIDLGAASTPTVELAVISQRAQGGMIITASHNPQGWNALKLLNERGEFISAADGEMILALASARKFDYQPEDKHGQYYFQPYLEWNHLHQVADLALVDKEAITRRKFKIVVDGINSIGAKAIPHLLGLLGIEDIVTINDSLDGRFAHKPEPLAENLSGIMERVRQEKADLGIVVDPDVDRLAFIDERGEMFGEEYTLVAVADYVLANFQTLNDIYPGEYALAAVSNLSSSRALRDVAVKHGGHYEAAAVGEVNVVEKMKETKAVIGGEGNGGVIFPGIHYGRDALVGTALFLSALARSKKTVSQLRRELPEYFMVKDKIEAKPGVDLKAALAKLKADYAAERLTEIDGLKIDWDDAWVHLRSSNTEPIIRIYGEAKTEEDALKRVAKIKDQILTLLS